MELWIRSQDKTTLKQVNVIDIYTPAESSCVNYTITSEGWELGQYKTRQRTLEILDEIQYELSKRHLNYPNYEGIYEMPKE